MTRSYGVDDPSETNTEYCLYDEPHGDYVYLESWVIFIIQLFEAAGKLSVEEIRKKVKLGEKLKIDDYNW